MRIPNPANPAHTDNLASIALLEAQDWQGTDADLATSLFEYGFAWRNLPEIDEDGDDILIIYGIRGNGDYTRFDRCGMKTSTDPFKEWDWVDWDSFFSTLGTTREEWSEMPFEQKVYDLFNHHGYENIFGASYWEGFKIKE